MSRHFQLEEGACSGTPVVPEPAWSAPSAQGSASSAPNRKAFEPGAYAPDGGFVFVTNPPSAGLQETYDMAVREIGDVAPLSVLQGVYAHNRCAWWAIHRASD